MTPEALDFKDECDSIAALLDGRDEDVFAKETLFKGWTIHDIIGHLHLWNIAADQTLNEPEKFGEFITMAMTGLLQGGSHQALQDQYFGDMSSREIYDAWKDYYPAMAERFHAADSEKRVKWAGPDMSVKSCIIARQMEHWAHAQAIFDVLGVDRVNGDRLKNVAHIGVTTYSWSFKVNRMEPLLPKPYVRLTAPSGAIWEWNEPQADNRVEGLAEEFAQVVTQCRNIEDTNLVTTGTNATEWLKIAQTFAGGKETPPPKGARRKI
ncbi:MAG: TIGR03084 family protein [Hellea sp.]|nr:TIGR03084 family protein [Hellea sp.]